MTDPLAPPFVPTPVAPIRCVMQRGQCVQPVLAQLPWGCGILFYVPLPLA
ncbi:MAG: hypothetical protein K8F51_09050 [Comamonas sp.]|nr:hypothetical protein [Comamonas sp.]